MRKAFIIIFLIYSNLFAIEAQSKIEIRFKIGDEIVTNIDIIEEKKYLIFLRPNLKNISKSYVITLGSNGAEIWDGKNTYYIDAVKTQAVDTTGAGDIYAGAFLYGINYGLSFEVAGNLASLAASQVVSQYGPRINKSIIQGLLTKINKKT